MFTGLIQAIGIVERIESSGLNRRLWIGRPAEGFDDLAYGESVAVSGPCLTVETLDASRMGLFASGETLEKTTLDRLRRGDRVNLERALAVGDRLGGHMVSGHVDGVGRFLGAESRGEDWWCRFEIPSPEWRTHVVSKGSIAIDGISLTIAELQSDRVAVSVIPVTWHETTLSRLRPGDPVNLEFDLVGKYILRWLEARGGSAAPAGGDISLESLRQAGFL